MGKDLSPSLPIRSFPPGADETVRRYHLSAFRKGWRRSVLIGMLVTLLTMMLWRLDLFREFELRTLDARFRWRGSLAAGSSVAVVFIGDDSIAEFGRWPWSWDHHALLVDVLRRAGAKVILFDVFFTESPGEDESALLAAVTGQAGNVYLCSFFNFPEDAAGDGRFPLGTDLTEPVPGLLTAAAGTGHCNARPDVDGITRRVPLLVRHGEDLYPAALFRVAADVLGADVAKADLSRPGTLGLDLGDGRSLRIPVDRDGETMVNFLGGMESFPTYSYRQVLQADRFPGSAAVDLGDFRDRIVLVGATFTGNTDLRPTPFSAVYPMIGVQATLLDNILTNRFVVELPAAAAFALWLLLGGVAGCLAFALRPLASFPLAVLLGGGYLAAATVSLDLWRLRLDMTGPLAAVFLAYLAVTTAEYVEARKQKMRYLERMKFLGHLVESSTDAIVSFDLEGRVVSWNHGAQEIFGFQERQVRGRDWSFLSPPGERETVEALLRDAVGGKGAEARELRLLVSGGSAIPAQATFSPIRDSRGDLVGVSLICQDLSEKKRMIEMLVQSEKLAEIGRMGSGIVHEIKNPLTSIMMMSSILTSDGSLPEKAVKYADIIEKESQRILRLSKNILSFARPTKAEMRSVDVNAILGETLELAEYEMKKAKVSVRRELGRDLPAVRGDAEKLKQVFLNIVTNAGHAMEGGGELTVSSGAGEGEPPLEEGWRRCGAGELPAGQCVVVTIRDTGPGIPGEVMEKIFEPFFSTKAEGKGTGLGLYISRNIVMEHQGRIAVESREGAGAAFTIVLPRSVEAPAASP